MDASMDSSKFETLKLPRPYPEPHSIAVAWLPDFIAQVEQANFEFSPDPQEPWSGALWIALIGGNTYMPTSSLEVLRSRPST